MKDQTATATLPSHTPGTHRGEGWVKNEKEPGRERETAVGAQLHRHQCGQAGSH